MKSSKFYIILAFLALLCGLHAQAQTTPSVVERGKRAGKNLYEQAKGKVDYYLDLRDSLLGPDAPIDTAYLQRPRERLRLSVSQSVQGSELWLEGRVNERNFHTSLSADHKTSSRIQASYRNLSLSIGITSPFESSSNSDFELGFSGFGDKTGFDFSYQSMKSHAGTFTYDGTSYDIPAGQVSYRNLSLGGYYVFNSKRFSMSAVFSQSMLQRQSSGSFMLTGLLMDQRMRRDINDGSGQWLYSHATCLAVGGGYGYNLVLPHNWLVHTSINSNLILLKRTRFRTQDLERHMPNNFPELLSVLRMAGIYHFDRYYVGANGIFNFGGVGKTDDVRLGYSRWGLQTFFGVRI